MKKRLLLLPIISLFALSSCAFLDDFFDRDEPNTNQNDDNGEDNKPSNPEDTDTDTKTSTNKIGEFYGGVVDGGDFVGYEFSKSTESISKPTTGVGTVDIYSFNDFHGAVVDQTVDGNHEPGLKTLGTFYKNKSQLKNTLVFDQGDTWQGSLESNYNYGAIVQDVFNYAGVSLRTVGNHDFDWGLSHLQSTIDRKIEDDYIPCLASNVYNFENGHSGNKQQSQYGKEYATFVMDNGIKVGVVGVIGESQITSISSQLVQTVTFTSYVSKIKEVSDFLRTEKGCDIIIASTHEGSGDAYDKELSAPAITTVSPVSNKRYVDLVLGGHSHYYQNYENNGVKFVQWASNGVNSGLVTLKYDFANNEVIDNQTSISSYNANTYSNHFDQIDPVIDKMVDDYINNLPIDPNEELATFSGSWGQDNLSRLMAEAIYGRVKDEYDVDFAMTNICRSAFEGSVMKYHDLYKSFPFDNEIVIFDISSDQAMSEFDYSTNYAYKKDPDVNPVSGNTYKIAVIDYLGLHQNASKTYNYFPEAAGEKTFFNDTDKEVLTFRDILYDYLKSDQDKTFSVTNYTSSNTHFYR